MAQVGERLTKLEGTVAELRSDMADLRSEVKRLEGTIDTNFRWMVGILMTTWVTIILAIIIRIP